MAPNSQRIINVVENDESCPWRCAVFCHTPCCYTDIT